MRPGCGDACQRQLVAAPRNSLLSQCEQLPDSFTYVLDVPCGQVIEAEQFARAWGNLGALKNYGDSR